MGAHVESSKEILASIDRALAATEDPQEIVEVVVAELSPAFPLDRLTLRRPVDDVMLEIVGVWSAEPTALGQGAKMSVLSSSMPTILRSGKPVLQNRFDPAAELLEGIMLSEGIASYVTLPLRAGDAIVGLLSLSSRTPGAFTPDDVPFLEQVAALVGSRLP